MQQFIEERVQIGAGRMAKVYLWQGFAYKCFESDYPDAWIEYEVKVQNTISQSGLPTVNYYASELPKSIKMDYIEGISLADRILKDKHKNGIEDLICLIDRVHAVKAFDLPDLNSFLIREIGKVEFDEKIKAEAIRYVSELPEGDTLCHLDFHYLNILFSKDQYYIIDWINAKRGNPIFDFARSYVILHEHVFRMSKKFLTQIKKIRHYEDSDFNKVILVMAVHRLSETDSDRLRLLIDEVRNKLI